MLNTSASHLVGHNVKHNEGTQAVRKHANRTRESRMLLHKFLVMIVQLLGDDVDDQLPEFRVHVHESID